MQLVFLRAVMGLLIMLPWMWMARNRFRNLTDLRLHGLRVLFSTLALTTSFFAIARLPFGLFTAIGFTRPIIMMGLAALILHEHVPGKRWIAAVLAFVGVLIAVDPSNLTFTWGLPVMFLTVLFGTAAVITTRMLNHTPTVVLMAFYAVGLTLLTAPLAWASWVSMPPSDLLPLLAIGGFAQSAQFCFLQAHRRAEAGFLAILGYLSLLLTTAVGYLVFDEVPTLAFAIGATLIVAAALWVSLSRSRRPPSVSPGATLPGSG